MFQRNIIEKVSLEEHLLQIDRRVPERIVDSDAQGLHHGSYGVIDWLDFQCIDGQFLD